LADGVEEPMTRQPTLFKCVEFRREVRIDLGFCRGVRADGYHEDREAREAREDIPWQFFVVFANFAIIVNRAVSPCIRKY
jgi:hypothetical protein